MSLQQLVSVMLGIIGTCALSAGFECFETAVFVAGFVYFASAAMCALTSGCLKFWHGRLSIRLHVLAREFAMFDC